MRKATTALLLTTALLGWTPAAARAQDKPATEPTSADSAEDAFLKAYFAEKELKDYATAEKAYAAVISTNGASHEVVARSTLGRARCLAQLKRDDESAALYAKVEKDFADIADVAKEAREARKSDVASTGAGFEAKLRDAIFAVGWENRAPQFGDRAVPALTAMLRDDAPDTVFRAATVLSVIDTPAAIDALTKAIDSGDSPYPTQVIDGATSHWSGMRTLERLASSKNETVRASALRQSLGRNDVPEPMFARAAEDVTLCGKLLRPEQVQSPKNCIVLLWKAIEAGGASRDLALARIGDKNALVYGAWLSVIAGLGDPPASVLRDPGALRVVAESLPSSATASDAFVDACLANPETEKFGVRRTIKDGRRPFDPDKFVDAFARVGLDGYVVTGMNSSTVGAAVTQAIGDKPPPDRLRRVAAAWRNTNDWLGDFVKALVKSGVTDEASLLALDDGLSAPALRAEFIRALAATPPAQIGPWAVKAFVREFDNHDPQVRGDAVVAMRKWRDELRADLTPYAPALVALLADGNPHIDDPTRALLVSMKAPAAKALRDALPTHPNKVGVVLVLGEMGDKSAADEIERMLRTSDDRAEVLCTARALAAIRGDDAKDALAAALVRHDGKSAHDVLAAGASLGAATRVELLKIALAKVPGPIGLGEDGVGEGLSADALRELAVAALRSSSDDNRAWGASKEYDLLDVAAWDALLAAAEDHDTRVRDTARDALRAIRAKENEMAEFRAMGEERATRKRITSLIESTSPEERRAGVAAIAATGLAGMVNDLIRLAAEDRDGSVREDARKALLAMAKPATPTSPAPQPAAEKK